MKIPQLPFDEASLSGTSGELHELLVESFGLYINWCKKEALKRTKELVESEAAREAIGRVFRKPYEEAAEKLNAEQRKIAENLQNQAIVSFTQFLLIILTGIGFDKHLGEKYVARLRLVMEVCDKRTGECVREEVINRNGRKAFMDYLKEWVNEPPKT
jgi:hypothetical protein